MLAGVIISGSTRNFDIVYTYRFDEEIMGSVRTGMRVLVPFGNGNRSREGLVVKIHDIENSVKEKQGMKDILAVLDTEEIIDTDGLRLLKWMKNRYMCSYYDAIFCMVPAGTSINIKRYFYIKNNCDINKLSRNEKLIYEHLKDIELASEAKDIYRKIDKKKADSAINNLLRKNILGVTEEYERKGKEKKVKAAFLQIDEGSARELIESDEFNDIRKIRIFELLLENEFILLSELLRITDASRSIVNTMEKKGYLGIKDVQMERSSILGYKDSHYNKKELTLLQKEIYDELTGKIDKGVFEETLLYGITGSGKSEIYMHLIEDVLSHGKSVIVLVPEIALTSQMLSMFSTRFGRDVALLHSRLSIGERYDQWHRIKNGKAKVVLGTRSAVFAPVKNLGLVIIDEEHDTSYKSETTPKYHAGDIARKRCIDKKAILLLGSATPRIESYYNAMKGKISYLELTKRVINDKLPQVMIIDMKNEVADGRYRNISHKLVDEIRDTLTRDEQVMLLLNRRGYAGILVCNSCGSKVICPNCSISLTYHSKGERLICHYCGYTRKKSNKCIKCGAGSLIPLGTGTQQIEEELDSLNNKFNDTNIRYERMDIDTTVRKNSLSKILTNFKKNKFNTLIGTQMIAKGHDIHNVTLVGILSADMILSYEDFRANEKTFQLITQAAGRAGRGEKDGRVIVQCFDTENYSIQTALSHNYKEFYKNEIEIRKRLEYPPFANIGQLVLSGLYPDSVKREIQVLKEKLCEAAIGADTEIIGPSSAPVYKIKDRYRWRIIIKERDYNLLLRLLTKIYDDESERLKKVGIRISSDINPLNMQ